MPEDYNYVGLSVKLIARGDVLARTGCKDLEALREHVAAVLKEHVHPDRDLEGDVEVDIDETSP